MGNQGFASGTGGHPVASATFATPFRSEAPFKPGLEVLEGATVRAKVKLVYY